MRVISVSSPLSWRALFAQSLMAVLLLSWQPGILSAAPSQPADGKTILRILAARSAVETGIINALAKRFESTRPDILVKVIPAGALNALLYGREGKADLIITHHPPAEEHFVAEGFGLTHTQFMFGEYALFGPPDQVSRFAKEKDIGSVLRKIAEREERFLVPVVVSGTYRKIESLWTMIGVKPDWLGYQNSESGGTATLKRAGYEESFTIAELSAFKMSRGQLSKYIVPLYQGDITLRNPYSAIVVNPDKVTGAKRKLAEEFVDYLVSDETQLFINNYGVKDYQASLFYAAAHLDNALRANRLAEKNLDQTFRIVVIFVLSTIILAFMLVALAATRRILRAERGEQEARQLTNDLKYFRDMAEKQSAYKSAFLARISHEFRTPLNAIIGYAELIEEEAKDEKDTKAYYDIAKIKIAGRHLLNIVNNILDLAKIDAGKEDIQVDEVRVSRLFEEVKLLTHPILLKSQNVIMFKGADNAESIVTDGQKLRQVLFNLIANSCKYTEGGTITIKSSREHSEEGDWLLLKVIDTGTGIDPEKLETIFEDFVQGKNSDKDGDIGTGLGLTISKEFIHLMGGTITVESEVGKGAEFSIYLPLSIA